MPRGPIRNLTNLVETKGAIVLHADFATDSLDGVFYAFPDRPPIFFLNKTVPGDRMRFTWAHELLEALMHRLLGDAETVEIRGPEEDLTPYLYTLDGQKLANQKRVWGMSMAAILFRARTLETLSVHQMSRLGYTRREPAEWDVPAEKPPLRSWLIAIHLPRVGYRAAEVSRAY